VSDDATVCDEMQWLAERKYGIALPASWSASSVPVQRKLPPPALNSMRATAFICVPHVATEHVASTWQAAEAFSKTWKSFAAEVTRCETWGTEIRTVAGSTPAGSSISIASVSPSKSGDQ
jgi:hypothetical protein